MHAHACTQPLSDICLSTSASDKRLLPACPDKACRWARPNLWLTECFLRSPGPWWKTDHLPLASRIRSFSASAAQQSPAPHSAPARLCVSRYVLNSPFSSPGNLLAFLPFFVPFLLFLLLPFILCHCLSMKASRRACEPFTKAFEENTSSLSVEEGKEEKWVRSISLGPGV